MYAIFKTGGKQLKAETDDLLIVQKINGNEGDKVVFDEVLMVVGGAEPKIGSPFVKGASVTGEIVRQAKTKKINAFNYKPKKNERKRWGARQDVTHVRVVKVEAGK